MKHGFYSVISPVVCWVRSIFDLFYMINKKRLFCDETNKKYGFLWLEFVLLAIILVVLFHQLLTLFNTTFFIALFVYILLFGFVFYYGKNVFLTYACELFSESVRTSYTAPELSSDSDHDGIMFIHYTNMLKEFHILDCVHLLADSYLALNRPYKIYHVYSRQNFEAAYTNPRVRSLWIVSHGNRGGFSYGGKPAMNFMDYSTLPEAEPKEFIMQVHSNCGEGKSLVEINHVKNTNLSYVSDGVAFSYFTRCLIKKKLAEIASAHHSVVPDQRSDNREASRK
jgi:hypothetical protein